MMRLFSNTAGSFVPNVLRQMNPDNTLRETRGAWWTNSMNRVPGLSNDLEPRRNIFGEPIMKPPGYSIRRSIRSRTWATQATAMCSRSSEARQGDGCASPTRGNVDMRDRESYGEGPRKNQSPYDRWLELVSKSPARKEMTELVKSEKWKQASDGTELFPGGRKFADASQILSRYQDRAWGKVLDEYPKLKQAMKADVRRTRSQCGTRRPSKPHSSFNNRSSKVGNSVERDIGEVKANVAELLRLVQADAESRKEIYKRLNSLERWRSGIVAAGTAVMAMFGILLRLTGK
jgi:hypothetical protein